MEPQLEGCGKQAFLRTGRRNLLLQWSRNLRVAERRARPSAPSAALASMEPQLEGCGKHLRRALFNRARRASMEPQLEGCGKTGAPCASGLPPSRFNGAAT